MFSSRPATFTHKYARATAACLAAGSLVFASSCSAFQRPEGASEEVSYGGKKENSGSNNSFSDVSPEISDDKLREIFADGKFSDCKLDQAFFDSAYVDGAKMQPLDSADVYVNSETCSGYIKPQISDDQPDELKETSIYTALSATKNGSNLDDLPNGDAERKELSDDGLQGWKSAEVVNACMLSGPEGTPLEYAEVISMSGCDPVKPLLRSLTNLANRYQELEGKEANIGGSNGPLEIGDRVEIDLADGGYLESRDKAKPKEESVTEKVGVGKTKMKLMSLEILTDNPQDYGKVCAEVEYDYEDESPLFPPTEIGLQSPDGDYQLMKVAGNTVTPLSDGKGSQRFCSEVGLRYSNSDFVIIGSETLTATEKSLEEEGMPLWRFHVKRNDEGEFEFN
ncbi:hypothetical protein ACN4D7_04980 [Corynebacterium macclintockiae]|uniref:hypothetical protein n=1 Tax=Corynebacterium macclintockiae TaxID=2913501 RepID=UPI003EBD855F